MGFVGLLLIVLCMFGIFFAIYIKVKKEFKPTICPNCDSDKIYVNDSGKIKCGNCGLPWKAEELI